MIFTLLTSNDDPFSPTNIVYNKLLKASKSLPLE